jgi:hypothetical protein
MIISWIVAGFSLAAGMLLALFVLSLQLVYILKSRIHQTPALKTHFVGIPSQNIDLSQPVSLIETKDKVKSQL